MTREEQIKLEMNPETNPLIPGGKAARQAIVEMENTDPSRAGENKRMMRPEHNFLVSDPEKDLDPNFDLVGRESLTGADPNENYVWSEKSGLYFPGTMLNGR